MCSNWIRIGSLAAGMIGCAQFSQAATTILTIDAFGGVTQELDLSGTTGSLTERVTVSDGMTIGGEREFSFTVDDNPLNGTAVTGIFAGSPGYLFMDLAPQVQSLVEIVYNGVAGAGLGGIDLGTGDATSFVFGAENLDAPATFSVIVTDINGNAAMGSTSHPGGIFTLSEILLPFSEFSNLAATDFSKADKIEFIYDPTEAAADHVLDYFATGVPAPVPEPASATILIASSLLALRRRRPATRES